MIRTTKLAQQSATFRRFSSPLNPASSVRGAASRRALVIAAQPQHKLLLLRGPNNSSNHAIRRRLSTSSSTATSTAAVTNKLRPTMWSKFGWFVVILGAVGAERSIHVVSSGDVAVVEILGTVQDLLLQPGLHIVVPWAHVTKFNIQPREIALTTKARIRGGLFVDFELLVVYKLDPQKVKDVYLQSGALHDQQNWHVPSLARSVLHAIVARKTMEQVHETQQLSMAQEIQTKLQEISSPEILVERVIFQKVTLPAYLVTAIQDLHQVDLDSNANQRQVDGRLAVARGMAAARNVLKQNQQPDEAVPQKEKAASAAAAAPKSGWDGVKEAMQNHPQLTQKQQKGPTTNKQSTQERNTPSEKTHANKSDNKQSQKEGWLEVLLPSFFAKKSGDNGNEDKKKKETGPIKTYTKKQPSSQNDSGTTGKGFTKLHQRQEANNADESSKDAGSSAAAADTEDKVPSVKTPASSKQQNNNSNSNSSSEDLTKKELVESSSLPKQQESAKPTAAAAASTTGEAEKES